MRVAHEEPPKPVANKRLVPDQYDRILVQVTKQDIDAGQNKIHQMQRDGYIVDDSPEHQTGVENYVYMIRPLADVIADRIERTAKYKAQMHSPIGAGQKPEGADGHFSGLTSKVEEDKIDPATQAQLSAIVAAANS